MTIDKAMTVELGVEALKRVSTIRKRYSPNFIPMLPGRL